MGKVAPLFEIIYQTVQDERNDISVETLCEIAGVSRSGYYAWVAAIPERKKREEEDRADFKLILIAYNKRGYTKGARVIYMCLLHMEPPIIMNLKKIRRLRYPLAIPHLPKLSVIQKKPEKSDLFISNREIKINADVNGSYQIMKKVFPKAFADGIKGVALHPIRVNIA